MSVESDTKLRREFRAAGCEYRVVKNTLLGQAAKGTPMEVLEPLLAGPTAIAYSFEDPSAPAKVATKVAKGESKFVIKGGCLDGRLLGREGRGEPFSAAGQARNARHVPGHTAGRSAEFPALAAGGAAEFRVSAFSARGGVEGGREEVASRDCRGQSFEKNDLKTNKEIRKWPM